MEYVNIAYYANRFALLREKRYSIRYVINYVRFRFC